MTDTLRSPAAALPNPQPAPDGAAQFADRHQVVGCLERDGCLNLAVAGGWPGLRCDECPLAPPELRSQAVCQACGFVAASPRALKIHIKAAHEPRAAPEREPQLQVAKVEREHAPPPVIDLADHRRLRDERDLYRQQLDEAIEDLNELRRNRLAPRPTGDLDEIARLRKQVQELGDALLEVQAASPLAPAADPTQAEDGLVLVPCSSCGTECYEYRQRGEERTCVACLGTEAATARRDLEACGVTATEAGKDVAALALHARGLERRLAEAQRSDEDHRAALVTTQRLYNRAAKERRAARLALSLAEGRAAAMEATRERLERAARAVVEGAQEAEACGLPVRVVGVGLLERLTRTLRAAEET